MQYHLTYNAVHSNLQNSTIWPTIQYNLRYNSVQSGLQYNTVQLHLHLLERATYDVMI